MCSTVESLALWVQLSSNTGLTVQLEQLAWLVGLTWLIGLQEDFRLHWQTQVWDGMASLAILQIANNCWISWSRTTVGDCNCNSWTKLITCDARSENQSKHFKKWNFWGGAARSCWHTIMLWRPLCSRKLIKVVALIRPCVLVMYKVTIPLPISKRCARTFPHEVVAEVDTYNIWPEKLW